MTQAWMTARLSLSNPRKFPKLSDVTGKKRAPAKQTPEQLLANLRALSAMFQGDEQHGE
jgi:hypothetical protein